MVTVHIKRAVASAGNMSALARLCGVSAPAVRKWVHGGQISAVNALRVQIATGGRVTACDLRPDIFGPDAGILSISEGGGGHAAVA